MEERLLRYPGFMRLFLAAQLLIGVLGGVGACSSGGGDDPVTVPTLSISQQTVNFEVHVSSATPAPVVIGGQVSGLSASNFLGVNHSNDAIQNVTFEVVSGNIVQVTVYPKPPTFISAGLHQDTIEIYVCEDASCTTHITGSPQTINVFYRVNTTLSTDTSALIFNYALFAPEPPPTQTVGIQGDATEWVATTDNPWIMLGNASGTAPADLMVNVNPDGLTAGLHTGIITVTNTNNTNEQQEVSVSLYVQTPQIIVDDTRVTIGGINGTTMPRQLVSVSMNNLDEPALTITTSDNWITVDTSQPGGIVISVDPSMGSMHSGSYQGTVTITGDSFGYPVEQRIIVDLLLRPASFMFSVSDMTLGSESGRDFRPQTLQVALNTGENAYPWSATIDSGAAAPADWLSADVLSGQLSENFIPIVLSASPMAVAPGVYVGYINFVATINGDVIEQQFSVIFKKDERRLWVNDNGIAFSNFPSSSTLTHSVSVFDTFGFTDTAWTATADQSWLTVTGSGVAGDEIQISADPAGLALDTLHLATITLQTDNPNVDLTDTIRVGLWNSSVDPEPSIEILDNYYEKVQTDPIRPYIYVNNYGTDLAVYNAYTGALVQTITGVGGGGDTAVSSDGSTLWIVREAAAEITPVNLDNYSLGQAIDFVTPVTYSGIEYARPGGNGLLFTQGGSVFNATTGRNYGSQRFRDGTEFAFSSDYDVICIESSCYGLSYSVMSDWVTLSTPWYASGPDPSANCQDVAISQDDSRFYVACGSPYVFRAFDTNTGEQVQTLPGGAYPTNLEVAENGLIVAARTSGTPNIWIYDFNGVELAALYARDSLESGQLKVTGDSGRIVVSRRHITTNNYRVQIFSMPAP